MHEDNPWSKEAEENQSRKKQSDIRKMTWSPGEHTIRVLPSKAEGGLPFVKYVVHWIPCKTSKQDRPIIHAVDYKCPVCEFVSQLWSEVYRLKEEEEMTDKSPEVQKLVRQASKLRGKKTYDMNIIHRNDYKDEKGVIKIKRLVAGPTIWKSVIELGNSDKWGNPSTPGSRGYDLTVTVDGEGIKREYTILPDPERKPLTEEEKEALKAHGYDLAKLRKFSTVKEIFDVICTAKAPLDSVDLKKVKKELEVWSGETISMSTSAATATAQKEASSSEDEDEGSEDVYKGGGGESKDDVDTPSTASNEEVDDEEEKAEKAKADKDTKKEDKAFAKDEEDEDADVKAPADDEDEPGKTEAASESEQASDDESAVKLSEMDCRGTYDSEDVGCQSCTLAGECKVQKKEFKAKAEQLGLSLKDMSGVEIEAAIKAKEKEAANKKPMGKMGKAGKSGESEAPAAASTGKRRDLPF